VTYPTPLLSHADASRFRDAVAGHLAQMAARG